MLKLNVEIFGEDLVDVIDALYEVKRQVAEGFNLGRDGNETGSFSYDLNEVEGTRNHLDVEPTLADYNEKDEANE